MSDLLAGLTTLRLGGPARELVRATTEDELLDAVRRADEAGTPVLLVAGGSNLVVADDGFDGTVVHVETRGVDRSAGRRAAAAMVTVAAGEPWDAFVERAVAQRLGRRRGAVRDPGQRRRDPDAERRRLRPGGGRHRRLGALLGPRDGVQRTFAAADCGFGYRTSRFKQRPGPATSSSP